MNDPTRHWELSESDFEERKFWDGYMRGFEETLRGSNTELAPWYLVPADHKWFRDFAASQLIVETLERMNPQYPPAKFDLSKVELD
jgi:polyphosphate kinase 2 (PPK2 family)